MYFLLDRTTGKKNVLITPLQYHWAGTKLFESTHCQTRLKRIFNVIAKLSDFWDIRDAISSGFSKTAALKSSTVWVRRNVRDVGNPWSQRWFSFLQKRIWRNIRRFSNRNYISPMLDWTIFWTPRIAFFTAALLQKDVCNCFPVFRFGRKYLNNTMSLVGGFFPCEECYLRVNGWEEAKRWVD